MIRLKRSLINLLQEERIEIMDIRVIYYLRNYTLINILNNLNYLSFDSF